MPWTKSNLKVIPNKGSSYLLLEQIIHARLQLMQTYLFTAGSQFGSKADLEDHGTRMAIVVLKQTLSFYRSRDSYFFRCKDSV